MEYIIALVLIGLLIYGLIMLIMYVGPIILSVLAGLAILYAFAMSVFHYIRAFVVAARDPDLFTFNDKEPSVRFYFFGPVFKHIGGTVRGAFGGISVVRGQIARMRNWFFGRRGWFGFVLKILGGFTWFIAFLSIHVFGAIFSAIFSSIHFLINLVFMLIIYVIFSITKLFDTIYLKAHHITADCPNCHERIRIPLYYCPDCGRIHYNLVPSKYGIFTHKCLCGKRIGCTFLTGRSKLDAYCPHCSSAIGKNDTRPIVMQLIGGTSSGKTVFLSALYHELFDRVIDHGGQIDIAPEYESYFNSLEEYYSGEFCEATVQTNSQLYPADIQSDSMKLKRKVEILDIAGEMFAGNISDSELTQAQFAYTDGFLFIIDPFAGSDLSDKQYDVGNETNTQFSAIDTDSVYDKFNNYLIANGFIKGSKKCKTPISVMVGKADLDDVADRINERMIETEYNNNPALYKNGIQDARNALIKEYLEEIGMVNVVSNIDAQFEVINYFLVSSMGHAPDGSQYHPFGVKEATDWIIKLADPEFSEKMLGVK